MAYSLKTLTNSLEAFAPLDLGEEWDNIGLLVGDPESSIETVLTCLTLTPDVAEEAIRLKADLIVSHHPVLFRSVKKLTTETHEGRMLLELIANKVAIYSPHTAFDSAKSGINQQLAESFGLAEIQPLRKMQDIPSNSAAIGSGRWGLLIESMTAGQFLDRVRKALKVENLQYTGDLNQLVESVAVACGSAGEFLRDANQLGCDLFLTGEARFHSCFEARELGVFMVLAGHYATERPAVETLAETLSKKFPDLQCRPSEIETDPVQWSLG
ncbi:putative GTP cyclohydrolase 1 type 2 [Thalassoglobus neptunius]|uniref:GTP cyclohydrolase 1 type 2 homolog n=1 Tax=Thalassoglobus neptunius TaxID=1938619 RepID=A0A5C5X3I7_9PLAN|nr:Nif3-like dinuclear metal center hexameric protein [Thalassoglobus neptunius]TWT57420.1 putative GTP cyclohydrolase 1 type 2 [Thalassoglobus neptunius]